MQKIIPKEIFYRQILHWWNYVLASNTYYVLRQVQSTCLLKLHTFRHQTQALYSDETANYKLYFWRHILLDFEFRWVYWLNLPESIYNVGFNVAFLVSWRAIFVCCRFRTCSWSTASPLCKESFRRDTLSFSSFWSYFAFLFETRHGRIVSLSFMKARCRLLHILWNSSPHFESIQFYRVCLEQIYLRARVVWTKRIWRHRSRARSLV